MENYTMQRTVLLIFTIMLVIYWLILPGFTQSSNLPLPENAVMRLGNGWSTSIDYASDGKHIAVGGNNGIWIHDVQSGEVLKLLTDYQSDVWSVRYSPDARIIACGCSDSTVQLWDIETGELINRLVGHSGIVYSIAFSPDGMTLVSGATDGIVQVWDLITGKQLSLSSGHTDKDQ